MKSKTRRSLQRYTLYSLVTIFVAGTLLLYLPISRGTNTATPAPALDTLQDVQTRANEAQAPPQGAATNPISTQPADQGGVTITSGEGSLQNAAVPSKPQSSSLQGAQ
jgi:hypothetical protein